ncbi:exodeoxyribonuclease VII large subunit [Moraxella nasovis]|uniref:exodeoxyribonuclease VII large subunit n=1 Tax=Moraxella nasovis TaxID=2904121 RepID=UPI001F60FB7B|nr:exodeoxyribonuclease VII large subunit [Moraxella nasovis]UNU73446.1 exodeoxyribonuclease VII large subunit [Moraxella nasovis]
MKHTATLLADMAAKLDQNTAFKDAAQDEIDALHAKIAKELADDSHTASNLADVQLSLSDYLESVKMVIDDMFNHDVWVQAEVRSINSKGGHYYFELAQKDDSGKIIASTKATLWKNRASLVIHKFINQTGRELEAGASILIKASAKFHTQYGFSISISDIDPTYTLGELAIAYNAMLKRLTEEGLTTLNKSLPMPLDIKNVIVVAPENAAGLGDFRAEADRLQAANACQFYYHHATFQGNHAPQEIRLALSGAVRNFINIHGHKPDLIVIIRGGGAVGDLAYLNDYELAALLAEQPVPVWVGIGHERDTVILDEVAHTRFDTPSKVIFGIQNHLVAVMTAAKSFMNKTQQITQKQLNHASQTNQANLKRVQFAANKSLNLAKKDSEYAIKHTELLSRHALKTSFDDIHTKYQTCRLGAFTQLETAKKHIHHYRQTHQKLQSKLFAIAQECRHLQSLILIQHPRRTLEKGYAIVRTKQGLIIDNVNTSLQSDRLTIEFADGKICAKPIDKVT